MNKEFLILYIIFLSLSLSLSAVHFILIFTEEFLIMMKIIR